MLDVYRKKRYYRPRILIQTQDVLSSPFDETILCLTGAELCILRNLVAYARRRVTWVSEYHGDYYLTPDDTDWDTTQALVAELEEKLMTGICEDLVAALEAIDATLTASGSTLGSMLTQLTAVAENGPDIVTALECICGRAEQTLINVIVNPGWTEYPDATDYFDWGTAEPNPTITAQADQEACELAQAWYQAGFEWMTEVCLPVMRFGFDKVLPAAAALLAAITGGIALPVTIGVYAVAELIQELLELGYDAAESNLSNWLYTHKQDLVCPMYTALLTGGSMSSIWPTIYDDLVDPAGDLSAGDKLLITVAYRGIAMAAAQVAQDQDSAWYQSVPEAGYCASCPEEPIAGSDWIAVPFSGAGSEVIMDHTSGSYWLKGCWEYTVPAGFTLCGAFYEVSEYSGNCTLKRMDGPANGCPGDVSFQANSSDNLSNGWYYQRDAWNHDHDECVAAVHPGASQQVSWYNRTDAYGSGQFQSGWNCVGYAKINIRYLVFLGTTPP